MKIPVEVKRRAAASLAIVLVAFGATTGCAAHCAATRTGAAIAPATPAAMARESGESREAPVESARPGVYAVSGERAAHGDALPYEIAFRSL